MIAPVKMLEIDDLEYVSSVINAHFDTHDPLVLPPETRDRLASCLTHAYEEYAGWQLPQIERTAAMLYWLIVDAKPLPDGNKRVAAVATALFLLKNGYLPTWSPEEMYATATVPGSEYDGDHQVQEDLALLISSKIRPLSESAVECAILQRAA